MKNAKYIKSIRFAIATVVAALTVACTMVAPAHADLTGPGNPPPPPNTGH